MLRMVAVLQLQLPKDDLAMHMHAKRTAYPFRGQKRVDRLLRQEHAIRLSTQVRKLDPCPSVVLRT